MFDDPELWKEMWDFIKSVTSDTAAPWVNRALPHLVSPTIRMVRNHAPNLRRVVAGQFTDTLVFVRGMPRLLGNRWLLPMTAAIPVGIGMEATQWGATAEVAGGALASLYACAAVYFIIRGGGQRIVNRFR